MKENHEVGYHGEQSDGISGWSQQARQLRRVERDIRDVEVRIANGEQADTDGVEIGLPAFLAGLQAEKAELEAGMQGDVQAIDKDTPKGQWRWQEKPVGEIKQALVALTGYDEARRQLQRENPEVGEQAMYLALDELATLVQAGRVPVPKDFWRRQVLSRPVEAQATSTKSSSHKHTGQDMQRLRESRYFDPDDWRLEEERRTDPEALSFDRPEELGPTQKQLDLRRSLAQTPSLPGRSVSSYDITQDNNGNQSMRESGEGAQATEDPWDKLDSSTRDQLRDMLSSGEAGNFYDRPGDSEPAKPEPVKPAEFLDRVHQDDDLRRIVNENDIEAFYGRPAASAAEVPSATGGVTESQLNVRPAEPGDAERVGTGGMGNEPWALDDFGVEGRPPEDSPEPPEAGEPTEPGPGITPEAVGEVVEIPGHILGEIPKVPSQVDVLSEAEGMREGLDDQIRAVAEAKENREKLWNLRREKRAETLVQEQGKLDQLHNEYLGAWAYRLAQLDQLPAEIDQAKAGFQSEIDGYEEEIARVEASDSPDGVKQVQIRRLQRHIAEHRAGMAECDQRKAEARVSTEAMRINVANAMTIDLAIVRTRIEEAQSELKEGKLSQKFKNKWRKYPKTRAAIGIGLGVAGFALAGPLGTAAGLAAVGMRGVGGYMAGEGVTNSLHGWRADRADRRATENMYNTLDSADQASLDAGVNILQGQVAEGPMQERYQADIENFMRRHPMGPDRIMAVLRGEAGASAEVAGSLLSDQQERVSSDAKSNRRAKVIGAATGTAAVLIGQWMRHEHGGGGSNPKPPVDPKPPTAPPAEYDPNFDRWAGMASRNPGNMVQNWETMHAAASPAVKAAAEAGSEHFDQVYNAASKGMSLDQLHRLNTIIGAGARTIGNDKLAENMDGIANGVRNGVDMNRIMQIYNIPNSVA